MKPFALLIALSALTSCAPSNKIKVVDGRYITYRWQRAVAPALLAGVAGACWGVHETVVHHPDRIPDGWNKRFWGPDSWRNKYKGGDPSRGAAFPGSTTVLVWTTDAKHLFGSMHRVTMFGAGMTISLGEPRPVWHYLADAGISFLAFSAGFHGTYSLAFQK